MNRKELKKSAKKNVKGHYLLFLIICLLALLAAGDFASVSDYRNTEKITAGNGIVQVEKKDNAGLNLKISKPSQNKELSGKKDTVGKIEETADSFSVKNAFDVIWESAVAIVKAGTFAKAIPSVIALLVYLLIWIFALNVVSLIMRRIILEGRTYRYVPAQHAFHAYTVHKWAKSACAWLKKTVYFFLWSLTIVGGWIKYFSYYLTGYILAENPDINGSTALTMSRKMMNGHKWEAFVLELSFLPWNILNILTLGLLGVFWLNPYKEATRAEYYVSLREKAKEENSENADLLNDTYLYEPADDTALNKAYKDFKMDAMYIRDNEAEVSGFQKFLADKLSLWIGSRQNGQIYQGIENLKCQNHIDQNVLNKESYPTRLSPLYVHANSHIEGRLDYNRCYSIWSLILIFFLTSFLGWGVTVSESLMNTGTYGTYAMHGPWIAAYGVMAVLTIILFKSARRHPVVLFFGALIVAGAFSWSFHLFGIRTAAGNTLVTACFDVFLTTVFNMTVVYLIAPFLDYQVTKGNQTVTAIIALILLVLFVIDAVVSGNSATAAVSFAVSSLL